MNEATKTGYPSIDKPWLKHYEAGVEHAEIPSLSTYQTIKNENQNRLDTIAIDYRSAQDGYRTGFEMTYAYFGLGRYD